jgi:hypothetical protein
VSLDRPASSNHRVSLLDFPSHLWKKSKPITLFLLKKLLENLHLQYRELLGFSLLICVFFLTHLTGS